MKLAVLACLAACSATLDSPPPSPPGPQQAAAGGLQLGLVSGDIYDDLALHPGERMSDIAGLGVKLLRIEIEQKYDVATYKRIVDAASRYGIQVLALVQSNAVGANPLTEDIEAYAQQIEAKVDQLVAAIPNLRYFEIENEPDGYDFRPLTGDNPAKLGLLMVRVYEHAVATRTSDGRPQIVGFDFARPDEPAFQAVYDSAPITNHRAWRPSAGLRDGLPVDIVSIHAYGDKSKLPEESGYSYGGTMRDGMSWYLSQQFAQPGPDGNTSLFDGAPVWVTEVGFGWQQVGGLDRQAQALQQAIDILGEHAEIQAAFAYDYRDDEMPGTETAGLRGNSQSGYGEHPAYYTFQQLAGGRGPQTFRDVPLDYWAHDLIETIFARGITTGCSGAYATGDLEFCPERAVSESEIDAFIDRARGGNPPPPPQSVAATRDVMGCKLGNALGLAAPYRGTFDDVGPGDPCVTQIEGLFAAGIATGWDNGDHTRSFRPQQTLTRAEMATFVMRAYPLK